MTRLKWDEASDRSYEHGVDRGVLYPETGLGVPWNGIVSVLEEVSDSDVALSYLDGIKYRNRQSTGMFAAKLEAFTYPNEFLEHDGFSDSVLTKQRRKPFGLSYRTNFGDGHKVHLIYNALTSPSSINHKSIGKSADAFLFSWGISSSPVGVQGAKSSAHLVIDTAKASPIALALLEGLLYGTDTLEPSIPTPNDIVQIFESEKLLKVIDNDDGTFTVSGPEAAIQMLDPSTFQISLDSAVTIDAITYTISSL